MRRQVVITELQNIRVVEDIDNAGDIWLEPIEPGHPTAVVVVKRPKFGTEPLRLEEHDRT